MAKHIILGVHVTDRMQEAGVVQKLLSQYGCSIKTRIGLHDVSENHCSTRGVILLEMFGDEAPIKELAKQLAAVKGVEVKRMVFKA
jgi:metal-responsive CopG/Arc/MetJ family transcriptional regulator